LARTAAGVALHDGLVEKLRIHRPASLARAESDLKKEAERWRTGREETDRIRALVVVAPTAASFSFGFGFEEGEREEEDARVPAGKRSRGKV